mmetsp:Transcript_3931/g.10067  ORF Transcript_3931/g.10067 Transcript_3931/m.10067 type:complete len:326 (-) Transcript_3931:132-1109(-)
MPSNMDSICCDSATPEQWRQSPEMYSGSGHGAQFCTMDDDEDDVALAPQVDEFDLWEHQQFAVTASRTTQGKERVTALQMLFLEELAMDSDVNGAAAKALSRLLAAEKQTAPSANAVGVEFMTLCDEEDRDTEAQLDEFDMWDQLQAAAAATRTEEHKRAITALQKQFLRELCEDSDINAAAARALLRLVPRGMALKPTIDRLNASEKDSTLAPAVQEPAEELCVKCRAVGCFRTLFEEELKRSGDRNCAAAAALRRLRQSSRAKPDATQNPVACTEADARRRQQALESLRGRLASEVGNGVDTSGLVAAALLRLRAPQLVRSRN